MEYLDIRTENGELTGEIKERTQVHTDGDIHGTSHVWLVRYTDKNKKKFDILLQKRAATKDAYAGCYDISSAGHIPAGQDYLESAVRELEEELGIKADPEKLKFIGMHDGTMEAVFDGKPFNVRTSCGQVKSATVYLKVNLRCWKKQSADDVQQFRLNCRNRRKGQKK